MPLGSDSPGNGAWTPADYLRRRARLDVLVRIGFWTTAGSVVLLVPACLGFSFFMPDWLAPFTFLPAPIVFLCGGLLFITAQLFADRIRDCPACTEWADADRGEASVLRECPRCGRWARPRETPSIADTGSPKADRRGFEVVMPGTARDDAPRR